MKANNGINVIELYASCRKELRNDVVAVIRKHGPIYHDDLVSRLLELAQRKEFVVANLVGPENYSIMLGIALGDSKRRRKILETEDGAYKLAGIRQYE